MFKNPKRLYNWLLFFVALLTAVKVISVTLLVAKYGDYQRAGYFLFLFDYQFSLKVFNFRYGPYEIIRFNTIVDILFILTLILFVYVYERKVPSFRNLLVGVVLLFLHGIGHSTAARLKLYVWFEQHTNSISLQVFYALCFLNSLALLFYIVHHVLLLVKSAGKSRIRARRYEQISYFATTASFTGLFIIFFIIDPIKLNFIAKRDVYALIDISLQYKLPLFYVTTLPLLVLIIMLLNLFALFRYSRVELKELIVIKYQEYKMQKVNQAVRFIFHSLKNDFFSLTLISKDLKKEVEKVAIKNRAPIVDLIKEQDELYQSSLDKIVHFLDRTTIIDLNYMLIDMNYLVQEIVSQLCHIYPQVNIVFRYPDTHYYAQVDKEKFGEAVRNCCINAVQASLGNTKREPKVKIDIIEENPWLAIVIEDSGEGISHKDIRYLFRPLNSGSTSISHWGIGLNYSHRIMRAHKGYIQVITRKKGGAVFELSAPVHTPLLQERGVHNAINK